MQALLLRKKRITNLLQSEKSGKYLLFFRCVSDVYEGTFRTSEGIEG